MMELKQVGIKKGQSSLTGLGITLLLVIGIFTAGYLFIDSNSDQAGVTLNDKYSEAYQNLNSSQNDLEQTINDMQTYAQNASEASNIYQVAINGFKGLGAALKAPIEFMSVGLAVFTNIFPIFDIIPGWIILLAMTGITLFVVLLVIKVMKGEPNM